jgi:hypothetical protein
MQCVMRTGRGSGKVGSLWQMARGCAAGLPQKSRQRRGDGLARCDLQSANRSGFLPHPLTQLGSGALGPLVRLRWDCALASIVFCQGQWGSSTPVPLSAVMTGTADEGNKKKNQPSAAAVATVVR